MGNSDTFDYSSIMFYMVGVIFGTSHSMTKIDFLAWIHTSLPLKMIRMAVAIVIYIAIIYSFMSFRSDTSSSVTDYFFYSAIPQLLSGFIVHGPLVLLCNKMGLVSEYKLK